MNHILPLLTGNYTILVLAAAITLLYFGLSFYAFRLDLRELRQIRVVFFQDNITESNVVYSVSVTIKERICRSGTSDLVFRLRGSEKDAPLILYRDGDQDHFSRGSIINVGVALPFSIGELLEVDVACNNNSCEEDEPVFVISDVYVRQYPRWTLSKARSSNSTYSLWKQRASTSVFSSLASDLITWVCLDTVTDTAGAGILGVQHKRHGRNHTLHARSASISFALTKENARLRNRAKLAYRPMHYLFSLSSKWHDAWSNFSRLDHVFVLLLDQLAGLVAVSICFGYAFEEWLGIGMFRSALESSYSGVQFKEITDFDMFDFFSNLSDGDVSVYMLSIVHILWIGFLCSLVIIPLSLMWCRLFRLIGGKGFEKVLGRSRNVTWSDVRPSFDALQPSAGNPTFLLEPNVDRDPIGTDMMLRTLECRSVHAGSCITTNRRLRVEPMICNCPPDYYTARSIAYLRSKMARLRDESIPSGPSGIKNPKLLHEAHTQSTDAPPMPQPCTAMDGKGHVVRVARYCERLVQEAPRNILDNTVIAECFEIAPGKPCGKKVCCPRRCCERNMKCCLESVSETTFFNDDDARSVHEMVSNFSSRILPLPHEDDLSKAAGELVAATDVGVEESGKNNRGYEKLSKIHLIRRMLHDTPIPIPSARPRAVLSETSIVEHRQKNTVLKMQEDFELFQPPYHSVSSSSSEVIETEQEEGILWIGHRPGEKRTGAVGSVLLKKESPIAKKTNKLHVQWDLKNTETQEPRGGAPFPSGMPASTYSEHEALHHPQRYTKSQFQAVMKLKKKFVAFLLLTIFQLGEIWLVTTIPGEGNNKFFIRTNPTEEYSLSSGRMHAATLSCLACLLFYFALTIHWIAFFSLLIDTLVSYAQNKEEHDTDDYSDYTSV